MVMVRQRLLTVLVASRKFLTSMIWTQLVLVHFHFAVLFDCLCHHLAAVRLKDLVGAHFILFPILNRLLAGDCSSYSASRSILSNSLGLKRLHEFGIFGKSINIRFLQ